MIRKKDLQIIKENLLLNDIYIITKGPFNSKIKIKLKDIITLEYIHNKGIIIKSNKDIPNEYKSLFKNRFPNLKTDVIFIDNKLILAKNIYGLIGAYDSFITYLKENNLIYDINSSIAIPNYKDIVSKLCLLKENPINNSIDAIISKVNNNPNITKRLELSKGNSLLEKFNHSIYNFNTNIIPDYISNNFNRQEVINNIISNKFEESNNNLNYSYKLLPFNEIFEISTNIGSINKKYSVEQTSKGLFYKYKYKNKDIIITHIYNENEEELNIEGFATIRRNNSTWDITSNYNYPIEQLVEEVIEILNKVNDKLTTKRKKICIR